MNNQSLIPDRDYRFARWLAEPMLKNRGIYIKVALAAVMINLFGLVTSLFTMTVYDRVLPNNALSSLLALSIGLAVVLVFDFVLRILRAYFVDVAGADIDRDVGGAVFDRLLAIRMEMKRGSTGALAGMMRELETLRDFFASATLTAVVDVPFIILTLVFIAVIGGPVVLVPMAMIPIVVGAGWLTHPALDRLSAKSMKEGLNKQSVLVETIGALEMVKSTGAGTMLAKRWRAAMDAHSDFSLRQRLVSTVAITIAASANSISYAGVVIVGVFEIAAQNMTMGALIACSILSGRAVQPLAQIASLLSRVSATRTAYREIDRMMSMPSEGPETQGMIPVAIKGALEWRNVTFKYPGAAEPTLAGFSLKIPAGQKLAMLGRVGSGKSTIARTILGLYPPSEGLVMIDETDIRQFDPAGLRRHIGSALQDSVLLSGSVRDNILLDRPGLDDAEMLRAATMSGTHGFIGKLANGYDLQLADRGDSLSGGQRQSISLARALAGRPPILVFDEPTSAMDTQSESALIDQLAIEMAGRTVILITHRASLLRLVDRIVVVDQGRIVSDGPRDEIISKMNRPRSVA